MKIIKYLVFTVAVTLMCGCNDDLDLLPKDRMSSEEYFRTASDLELFTNPLYNNILPKVQYKDQSDIYVCQSLSNELMGAPIVPSPLQAVDGHGQTSDVSTLCLATLTNAKIPMPPKNIRLSPDSSVRTSMLTKSNDLAMCLGTIPN